jgi:hypothetical protein
MNAAAPKGPNTKWAVERRRFTDTGSETFRIGTVSWVGDGYRFTSNVASHGNSRKSHPTFEACLPRWVGYPDSCETRAI